MKAKQLAELLLQNPEANVVAELPATIKNDPKTFEVEAVEQNHPAITRIILKP